MFSAPISSATSSMVPIDASFYNFREINNHLSSTDLLSGSSIPPPPNPSADPTLPNGATPQGSSRVKRSSGSAAGSVENVSISPGVSLGDLQAHEASVLASMDPMFRNGPWNVSGFETGCNIDLCFLVLTPK